jgi:cell division ATPase FtsA
MIDLDKLSGDAASAVLDVIEEERRINKDDIREAIKKAVKPHLLPQVPGGYGVGAYMPRETFIDESGEEIPLAVMTVGKWRGVEWIDFPLLPDED